jgi:predicted nucleic acid-binding protein
MYVGIRDGCDEILKKQKVEDEPSYNIFNMSNINMHLISSRQYKLKYRMVYAIKSIFDHFFFIYFP